VVLIEGGAGNERHGRRIQADEDDGDGLMIMIMSNSQTGTTRVHTGVE
jgi:hypothetical protein